MAARIETAQFADDGRFPNSRLPVILYREAVAREKAGPEALEDLFAKNGWPPQWRSQVYTYDHYHSVAHEVLGIAQGHATMQLGGPEGREFRVEPGDVIVLPAGTAHRRITSSPDFLVVGGYPPGQENWDLNRGLPEERPKVDDNIARVERPRTDPVEGENGSLLDLWAE
jgi:uncharacterized protein YjlB